MSGGIRVRILTGDPGLEPVRNPRPDPAGIRTEMPVLQLAERPVPKFSPNPGPILTGMPVRMPAQMPFQMLGEMLAE